MALKYHILFLIFFFVSCIKPMEQPEEILDTEKQKIQLSTAESLIALSIASIAKKAVEIYDSHIQDGQKSKGQYAYEEMDKYIKKFASKVGFPSELIFELIYSYIINRLNREDVILNGLFQTHTNNPQDINSLSNFFKYFDSKAKFLIAESLINITVENTKNEHISSNDAFDFIKILLNDYQDLGFYDQIIGELFGILDETNRFQINRAYDDEVYDSEVQMLDLKYLRTKELLNLIEKNLHIYTSTLKSSYEMPPESVKDLALKLLDINKRFNKPKFKIDAETELKELLGTISELTLEQALDFLFNSYLTNEDQPIGRFSDDIVSLIELIYPSNSDQALRRPFKAILKYNPQYENLIYLRNLESQLEEKVRFVQKVAAILMSAVAEKWLTILQDQNDNDGNKISAQLYLDHVDLGEKFFVNALIDFITMINSKLGNLKQKALILNKFNFALKNLTKIIDDNAFANILKSIENILNEISTKNHSVEF